MNSANKDHYTYRITWSPEDQEYVGRCAEFPSLSWLAESQMDAFTGITLLVADTMADMKAKSEHVPLPIADKSHISFNRLISGKLAQI
ncbi:MAG: toxin-antitoxin system HicB family antitoxin [Proteobacteria bacterium]|nr:toxin-antitoxin system HicB family antitoxin [Desulfobulbaceae bacterium]MBU4152160.1 toxin-antitoxin system HicB family antitoxin [Pseudomonadota bacterium]